MFRWSTKTLQRPITITVPVIYSLGWPATFSNMQPRAWTFRKFRDDFSKVTLIWIRRVRNRFDMQLFFSAASLVFTVCVVLLQSIKSAHMDHGRGNEFEVHIVFWKVLTLRLTSLSIGLHSYPEHDPVCNSVHLIKDIPHMISGANSLQC